MPTKTIKTDRTKKPYLSIILPVYNEEDNINLQYKNIIDNVEPLKKNFEVIFVDDGSTDKSPELLLALTKKDKRIKVVQFRANFGQTAAMSAGINHSTGDIVLFMDSDLQNDASDIGKLINLIETDEYDVVSGWRKHRKDKFISRRLPSMIANKIISKVTGVPLHDLGCSLKAYRGDIIREVKLYGEMHRFIPIYASWLGAKITEIPVNHHPRQFGKSKYGIKRTFKVVLDLITVKFLGSYSTKPIYVFGGNGLILFLLSLVSGTAVILMKLLNNHSMTRNPLLLLTILLIILSMMFISLGIMAELLIRIYHETGDKKPYTVKKTFNF